MLLLAKLSKRGGKGATQSDRKGCYFYSPQSSCHKIKDGGYNNKLSPAQDTPALQAKRNSIITFSKFLDHCTHAAQCTSIICI